MKSYTDLEQSKRLSEILSLNSADMKYPYFGDGQYGRTAVFGEPIEFSGKDIPCWSLAALLGVVSEEISLNSFKGGNWNAMVQQNGKIIYSDADNPIDACYEMIIKLYEQKLL